jgi:hypothetical protein
MEKNKARQSVGTRTCRSIKLIPANHWFSMTVTNHQFDQHDGSLKVPFFWSGCKWRRQKFTVYMACLLQLLLIGTGFSQASFGESCSDKFLLSPPIRRSNTNAQPDHGDFSSLLCECMPIKWFSGYILQNTGITLVVTRQSADLLSKHYTGILQSLLVFLRIFPRLLVKSVLGISIASWPTLWLSSSCLDIGCGG